MGTFATILPAQEASRSGQVAALLPEPGDPVASARAAITLGSVSPGNSGRRAPRARLLRRRGLGDRRQQHEVALLGLGVDDGDRLPRLQLLRLDVALDRHDLAVAR